MRALLIAIVLAAAPAFAEQTSLQPGPSTPAACAPLFLNARKIAAPRYNEPNLLNHLIRLEGQIAACDDAGLSSPSSETNSVLFLLDAKLWQLQGRSHTLAAWASYASSGYDVEPDSLTASGNPGDHPTGALL